MRVFLALFVLLAGVAVAQEGQTFSVTPPAGWIGEASGGSLAIKVWHEEARSRGLEQATFIAASFPGAAKSQIESEQRRCRRNGLRELKTRPLRLAGLEGFRLDASNRERYDVSIVLTSKNPGQIYNIIYSAELATPAKKPIASPPAPQDLNQLLGSLKID